MPISIRVTQLPRRAGTHPAFLAFQFCDIHSLEDLGRLPMLSRT